MSQNNIIIIIIVFDYFSFSNKFKSYFYLGTRISELIIIRLLRTKELIIIF